MNRPPIKSHWPRLAVFWLGCLNLVLLGAMAFLICLQISGVLAELSPARLELIALAGYYCTLAAGISLILLLIFLFLEG